MILRAVSRAGFCGDLARLALAGLLALVAPAAATAQEPPAVDEPRVVVHAQVPVDELDRNHLRAIFGMKYRSWPDGGRIEVFVLPDRHPVHTEFTKKVLGIFPHNLRRVWDRQVYSGTGQSPREVENERQMQEMVSSTPNAIGYLRDRAHGGGIKVIRTR